MQAYPPPDKIRIYLQAQARQMRPSTTPPAIAVFFKQIPDDSAETPMQYGN